MKLKGSVESLKLPLTKHEVHQKIIKGFFYIFYNPLWLVWFFRIPILENICWWLLLFVLEAPIFQNTANWMFSSLSNRAIFFSEYFYLKNHPKNTCWDGMPSLLFIMFSWLLVTPPLLKNFSLLTKRKDFDFFKTTLSKLNTVYIKLI